MGDLQYYVHTMFPKSLIIWLITEITQKWQAQYRDTDANTVTFFVTVNVEAFVLIQII